MLESIFKKLKYLKIGPTNCAAESNGIIQLEATRHLHQNTTISSINQKNISQQNI